MLGVTCALFFALAICHLTLYAQLSIGVGLADYCSDPQAAQESSLELPGKFFANILLFRPIYN